MNDQPHVNYTPKPSASLPTAYPSTLTLSMYQCQLLAVNMRRMNAIMHALLSTNEDDDILCVQESWFSQIRVQ